MNARVPAEVFPPGEFLREELEAREWSQEELADILNRPARLVSELISGKRSITPQTAIGLAEAFGTSPEYWMNLESQYQLSKVRLPTNTVARKSELYSRFPVREMLKRGWIQATESIDLLEQQFCDFFGIQSVAEQPELIHCPKKTEALDEVSPLQLAWLFRVRKMAQEQCIAPYSKEVLLKSLDELQALMLSPEEIRHVPRILASAGVRLVFVEAMPGLKLDGACFWLGENPVIGMSLRFDRIDNFWFVLRHEIEHVLQEDGKSGAPIIDMEMNGGGDMLPEHERSANKAALDFCVSTEQLEDFIIRVQPSFSEKRILLFAQRLNIHPGLVVGQLQNRLKRYDFLRKHQVKIRQFILSSGNVDGWGYFSS